MSRSRHRLLASLSLQSPNPRRPERDGNGPRRAVVLDALDEELKRPHLLLRRQRGPQVVELGERGTDLILADYAVAERADLAVVLGAYQSADQGGEVTLALPSAG